MKFVKISLFLLSAGLITANAEVDPLQKLANTKNNLNAKFVGTIPSKTKSNKISAINFVVFDSMANSLSYMNDQTQPFIYEPGTGSLITVKRGSHEVTKPDFNRSNSKNNLFLRTSKDWGKTWNPSFLLYDKSEWRYGEVRYPSVAAYKNDSNNLMIAYTFALIEESASTWKGFATGFYGDLDQDGYIQSASLPSYDFTFKDAELDGTYAWGQLGYSNSVPNVAGTDSKIIAFNDKGLNILATGIVTPLPEGNVKDNNNIAFRYTNKTLFNSNEISTGIPAAWNSKRFGAVDTVTTRSNNQLGLERTSDGKIYFATFGNFETAGSDTKRNEVGVSISNDNGKTWSEYEVFPFQKIREYVSGIQGHSSVLNPELFFIGFTSKNLVAFDNGDWSVFVVLQETKDTVNAKLTADLLYQVVELYKEGGTYGVRTVAKLPTYWVPFSNSDGTQAGNSKDYELQASKTIDGSKIVCKWVELKELVWPTDSTFQFAGSDIFAAARIVGANKWGNPKNLTDDGNIYKGVWIPNLLPNNLVDIPILYSQTKGDLAVANQRRYIDEQYVMIGNFDGSLLTSVEDDQILSGDVNIYPNPAVDNSTVRFYVPNMENVEIRIVDIFGKEISSTIVNSLVGFNNFEIDTKKYAPGAYFVSIKGSNIAKFEKFNVVK